MIDPGEGYRLLEKGEVIQEGDEVNAYGWRPTSSVGYKVGGAGAALCEYRRKLPPHTITVSIDIPAPPKGYKWDGWRLIKEGETSVYLNTITHNWVFWEGKISTNIRFHVAIPDPDYDWLEDAELPVRFKYKDGDGQGTLYFKDKWGHLWGTIDDGICIEIRKEHRNGIEPA